MAYPKDQVLGQLSVECLARLRGQWTEVVAQPEQEMVALDENDRDVYFLLAGEAKIAVFTHNGKEVSFSFLPEGALFGEFAAIDNQPRSASVVAVTECTLARLRQDQFKQALATEPELAYALITSLVGRLRGLSARVTEFTSMTSPQRVRAEILRIAERHHTGEDRVVILDPPNQTTISSLIYCNREAVAREMAVMIKEGLIERKRRQLIVPSIQKLQDVVGIKNP